MFPGLPESGTKSRVETQIRLTVDLAHASASSGEPLKYDKVGSWKWLRLPKGTTTKKRTRKEGKVGALIKLLPPNLCLTFCSRRACGRFPLSHGRNYVRYASPYPSHRLFKLPDARGTLLISVQ